MPITVATSINDTNTTNFVSVMNSNLGGSAEIHFFDGILPGACEDADDGTLLASLAMSASPFASPSGNAFSANAITPNTVVADGTITYFRMKTGGGTCLLQGSAGTDSLRNIVFDNEDVLIGDTVSVTSFDVLLITGGP